MLDEKQRKRVRFARWINMIASRADIGLVKEVVETATHAHTILIEGATLGGSLCGTVEVVEWMLGRQSIRLISCMNATGAILADKLRKRNLTVDLSKLMMNEEHPLFEMHKAHGKALFVREARRDVALGEDDECAMSDSDEDSFLFSSSSCL